ncbi:MAG: substrate-binding domain-containing protein [Coriobacteriales bacterium]|jgi:NitT/TauT family transport system substrate-binding protein|nr:substrate-binding domain-containing protein [Coriobacteriales bacterium]
MMKKEFGVISRRSFVKTAFGGMLVAGAGLALPGCATKSIEVGDNGTLSSEGEQVEKNAYTVNWDTAESLTVGAPGKDIKIACIVVAYQLGLYKEENLDVTIETIASLSDGITAVSEDKLDVLPFGVIPTCTFVGQGVENVVVFGGTIAEGSEVIALPENKDSYKAPADFRSKKIGFFPMETGHLVMQGLIADAGMDNEKDCEWIIQDSSASIMEGVRKGELDCGFVNSGYGYIAEQAGVSVALHVGDLKPDFPCCRQSTSLHSLEQKSSALVKFEVANLRAYEIIRNDKQRAIETIAEYSGQPAEYVESVIYGTDTYKAAMIVEMDPYTTTVCDFYEVMKQTNNIPADTPYKMEDHVDTTIYRAALDEMISRGDDPELFNELDQTYQSHNA